MGSDVWAELQHLILSNGVGGIGRAVTMTCFIFQAKGYLLLPLTLVPSLAGLVMQLTIANFLSTLLLGRCPTILPPTMDMCVDSSAFPA